MWRPGGINVTFAQAELTNSTKQRLATQCWQLQILLIRFSDDGQIKVAVFGFVLFFAAMA